MLRMLKGKLTLTKERDVAPDVVIIPVGAIVDKAAL